MLVSHISFQVSMTGFMLFFNELKVKTKRSTHKCVGECAVFFFFFFFFFFFSYKEGTFSKQYVHIGLEHLISKHKPVKYTLPASDKRA